MPPGHGLARRGVGGHRPAAVECAVLESLTISDFAPWIGDRFRVGSPEEGLAFDVQLADATPVGEVPERGRRVPFSLVFRARPDVVLPQRIYRVDHPALGSLDIFLVPIGPDSTGMRYEAIFT